MKTIALFAAAALAVMAAGAQAAPTISWAGGTGTTAPGTTVFQDFDGYAAGASIGADAFAYGAAANTGARPAFGSTGNFAAVLGGGNYTVNFGPTNLFSFVLGSLDTYNTLTLFLADNSSISYAGGQMIGDQAFSSGNQAIATSNGVVTFNANGGPKIVGAAFKSSQNSFEFDNLAVAAAGVPEPSTWAMMIIGFGAVAGVMRRRRAVTAHA